VPSAQRGVRSARCALPIRNTASVVEKGDDAVELGSPLCSFATRTVTSAVTPAAITKDSEPRCMSTGRLERVVSRGLVIPSARE